MGSKRLSLLGNMGVSIKKVLLALANTLLLVLWILMIAFKFYNDKTLAARSFIFVATYTLWMVTGLAHLKVFKLKAKLSLLVCQFAVSLTCAICETVLRFHPKIKIIPAKKQDQRVLIAIIYAMDRGFGLSITHSQEGNETIKEKV